MFKKVFIAGAALAALPLLAGPASAAGILVTLNPSGASPALAGAGPFQTDNATIADNAVITFDALGNFKEDGVFRFTSFNVGLNPVSGTGLNTSYGLYGTFHAEGSGGFNATPTVFTFTLLADPDLNTTFSGATVTGDTINDFVLATGSLLPSSANIASVVNPLSLHPTLTFEAVSTFVPDGAQSGFFTAPIPFVVNLDTAATATSTATNSNCPTVGLPCTITITGGGGNVNFLAVPEPSSLALLGAGLLGLGAVARRRRKSA